MLVTVCTEILIFPWVVLKSPKLTLLDILITFHVSHIGKLKYVAAAAPIIAIYYCIL